MAFAVSWPSRPYAKDEVYTFLSKEENEKLFGVMREVMREAKYDQKPLVDLSYEEIDGYDQKRTYEKQMHVDRYNWVLTCPNVRINFVQLAREHTFVKVMLESDAEERIRLRQGIPQGKYNRPLFWMATDELYLRKVDGAGAGDVSHSITVPRAAQAQPQANEQSGVGQAADQPQANEQSGVGQAADQPQANEQSGVCQAADMSDMSFDAVNWDGMKLRYLPSTEDKNLTKEFVDLFEELFCQAPSEERSEAQLFCQATSEERSEAQLSGRLRERLRDRLSKRPLVVDTDTVFGGRHEFRRETLLTLSAFRGMDRRSFQVYQADGKSPLTFPSTAQPTDVTLPQKSPPSGSQPPESFRLLAFGLCRRRDVNDGAKKQKTELTLYCRLLVPVVGFGNGNARGKY